MPSPMGRTAHLRAASNPTCSNSLDIMIEYTSPPKLLPQLAKPTTKPRLAEDHCVTQKTARSAVPEHARPNSRSWQRSTCQYSVHGPSRPTQTTPKIRNSAKVVIQPSYCGDLSGSIVVL